MSMSLAGRMSPDAKDPNRTASRKGGPALSVASRCGMSSDAVDTPCGDDMARAIHGEAPT